jgi:hypothetical protein
MEEERFVLAYLLVGIIEEHIGELADGLKPNGTLR